MNSSSSQAQNYASPEILKLANASNYMGLNLYQQLAKEGKNVFFSPICISTALAMLFYGSEGENAEEMRQVLGYQMAEVKDKDIRTAFEQLLATIDKNTDEYTLTTANNILYRKGVVVKDEFKSIMEDLFKTSLEEVDFFDESEAEAAVKRINSWVGEKTNNMITSILESPSPSTVLLLLNAVYFKGTWNRQFDQFETRCEAFYNNGENYKEVNMMHLEAYFNYAEKDTYKVLELPYNGKEISMFILLPDDQNGLQEMEKSILNHNTIQELKEAMEETEVIVDLPKFKMEYCTTLNNHLQELGMNLAFQFGANFGGFSEKPDLFISDARHKAVLEVNEEGTEAAAVTGVDVADCISSATPVPEFIVDHPFLLIIYHSKYNMILFMGRIDEL